MRSRLSGGVGAAGVVVVGFDASLSELVVGAADALERLVQQTDDVADNELVISLRQPIAMQFPPVLVVWDITLGESRCSAVG